MVDPARSAPQDQHRWPLYSISSDLFIHQWHAGFGNEKLSSLAYSMGPFTRRYSLDDHGQNLQLRQTQIAFGAYTMFLHVVCCWGSDFQFTNRINNPTLFLRLVISADLSNYPSELWHAQNAIYRFRRGE